jgi:hypothetical protein
LGKSYSDYAIDWFNWLLSANANKRNSGPVVFLTSKTVPTKNTQPGRDFYNFLELGGNTTRTTIDPNANPPTLYLNEPHIRIGSDRLQIFDDQAVFVPIVVCYDFANAPYKDWGYMQDYLGLSIDNGDNPPDVTQLTINSQPVQLPAGLEMARFRIRTPMFSTVVPETPYGTSLKDFLEDSPISPGTYASMVDGYFVLLRLNRGSYWIHSWASAGREERGPYFSELLYQVEVNSRRILPHGRITVARPAQFVGIAAELATQMTSSGQLTEPEIRRFDLIQRGVSQLGVSERPPAAVYTENNDTAT